MLFENDKVFLTNRDTRCLRVLKICHKERQVLRAHPYKAFKTLLGVIEGLLL